MLPQIRDGVCMGITRGFASQTTWQNPRAFGTAHS